MAIETREVRSVFERAVQFLVDRLEQCKAALKVIDESSHEQPPRLQPANNPVSPDGQPSAPQSSASVADGT